MLFAALLLSTLAVQQPAAAPAKPQTTQASQQADTSKAKHRTRRAHKAKAKPATSNAPAQRDTTKKP